MTTALWIIGTLALWVVLVAIAICITGFNESDQEHDAAFRASLELDPDRRMGDDYPALTRAVKKVRAGGAK